MKKDPFTESEEKAAQDLGMKLSPEMVQEIRRKMKVKAQEVEQHVQFYALFVEKLWTPEESDDRIFAAARLLYEYLSPSGDGVTRREKKVDQLKDLILRLATEKGEELPIVGKIERGELQYVPSRKSRSQAAVFD